MPPRVSRCVVCLVSGYCPSSGVGAALLPWSAVRAPLCAPSDDRLYILNYFLMTVPISSVTGLLDLASGGHCAGIWAEEREADGVPAPPALACPAPWLPKACTPVPVRAALGTLGPLPTVGCSRAQATAQGHVLAGRSELWWASRAACSHCLDLVVAFSRGSGAGLQAPSHCVARTEPWGSCRV